MLQGVRDIDIERFKIRQPTTGSRGTRRRPLRGPRDEYPRRPSGAAAKPTGAHNLRTCGGDQVSRAHVDRTGGSTLTGSWIRNNQRQVYGQAHGRGGSTHQCEAQPVRTINLQSADKRNLEVLHLACTYVVSHVANEIDMVRM